MIRWIELAQLHSSNPKHFCFHLARFAGAVNAPSESRVSKYAGQYCRIVEGKVKRLRLLSSKNVAEVVAPPGYRRAAMARSASPGMLLEFMLRALVVQVVNCFPS